MCLFVPLSFAHLKSDCTLPPLFSVPQWFFKCTFAFSHGSGQKPSYAKYDTIDRSMTQPNRRAESPGACRSDSCLRPQPEVQPCTAHSVGPASDSHSGTGVHILGILLALSILAKWRVSHEAKEGTNFRTMILPLMTLPLIHKETGQKGSLHKTAQITAPQRKAIYVPLR